MITIAANDASLPAPAATPLVCLLGAPGTGKGTQGALIAEAWSGVHISVGELVRQQQAAGMKIPRDRRTRLVDTDYTLEMITSAGGSGQQLVVLDGFPRAAAQVPSLLELPWECRLVLWLTVDFGTAIARMKGRGRPGETTAQIGMRHFHHEAGSKDLLKALNEAGVTVAPLDANGDVEAVFHAASELVREAVGELSTQSVGNSGLTTL